MKVEVEHQPQSMATLRIELPGEQVSKEFNAIADNYARHARIPGYRPGKAPRNVIEAKFRKEIQEELAKRMISQGYRDAVAQEKLRVVSLTNVEDVEFDKDHKLTFRATVVTAPEFDLPEYKNIPVQLPDATVTPEDVDAALERLRDQSADFVDAPDRGLEMEDFAVIDFEGSVDGKPISEVAPDSSKNLQGGKKFWLRMAADNFLPGFCEQLVGHKRNDTLLIQLKFPEDVMAKELTGKTGNYAVTVNEIKVKVLPALDDAFAAKVLPGKNLEELRHTVEHDLEHEKEHEIARAKENQIVKFLNERVQFDLPPTLLTNETRRALSELVQSNRARGVPDEVLKTKEKELVEGAGGLAAHRLKTNFILHRIAEQEKMQITREELDKNIREQAAHYNVSVEKMRKQLEENDGLNGLAEQLLLGKTLDFLKANVTIELAEKPPAQPVSSEQKT
jgi:trigger factor